MGDGWTIRRAAEEFGVPKSTLYDRVSGRISFGARSGPPRYLTDQEEKELVSFLIGCAKIGFAKCLLCSHSLPRSRGRILKMFR